MQLPKGPALVVGVDDYGAYDASVGAKPGTSDLRGAVSDARAWQKALVVAGEDVKVLVDGEATRKGLIEALQAWMKEVAEAGGGTFVFAGHGAWDPLVGLSICPTDTRQPMSKTAGLGALARTIGLDEIVARLVTDVPATGVTFVLDCGFTGAFHEVPKGLRLRTLTPNAVVPVTHPWQRHLDRWIGPPPRMPWYEEFANAVAARGPARLTQFGANHSGMLKWDLYEVTGTQRIGTFLICTKESSPPTPFLPGRDYWFWDRTVTERWPDTFRMTIRPDPNPSEMPWGRCEVYPHASFAGAPLDALASTAEGRTYQLYRRAVNQTTFQAIEAHLWCHGSESEGRQEWFARDDVLDAAGYIGTFGIGVNEVLFTRITAPIITPSDRRVLRLGQIAPT